MASTPAEHGQGYAYSAIDSSTENIRLLTIDKEVDSVISCTLQQFPIDACPPYAALSYAWGSEESPRTIRLNGMSFPVRSNLHVAMRRLASPKTRREILESLQLVVKRPIALLPQYEPGLAICGPLRIAALDALRHGEIRFFWIDAICIDQGNVEERNHQVRMMSKIFSHAQYVISDLGESSIKDAPVFSRIWVFQELLLPKVLLFMTLWGVETPDSVASSGVIEMLKLRDFYYQHGGLNLQETLIRAHVWQSADPRDVIFALLGLEYSLAIGIKPITVDYRLSAEEVYLDALRFCNAQPDCSKRGLAFIAPRLARRMGLDERALSHNPLVRSYIGEELMESQVYRRQEVLGNEARLEHFDEEGSLITRPRSH